MHLFRYLAKNSTHSLSGRLINSFFIIRPSPLTPKVNESLIARTLLVASTSKDVIAWMQSHTILFIRKKGSLREMSSKSSVRKNDKKQVKMEKDVVITLEVASQYITKEADKPLYLLRYDD